MNEDQNISAVKTTNSRPLSLCEAAPEVIYHGHQEEKLSLEAGQLIPPVMPVCHVLGTLVKSMMENGLNSS